MKEHVQDAEQERFVKYEEKQIEAALRKQVREEEGKNLKEQQTKRRASSAEAATPQVQEQSSSSGVGEQTRSSMTKRKAQFEDGSSDAEARSSTVPKTSGASSGSNNASDARLRPKRAM